MWEEEGINFRTHILKEKVQSIENFHDKIWNHGKMQKLLKIYQPSKKEKSFIWKKFNCYWIGIKKLRMFSQMVTQGDLGNT
jgi:hypothetical protein